MKMRFAFFVISATALCAQTPQWLMQESGTQASLRGVSAVTSNVVWASGSGGTWLRTADGGATWHAGTVPGAEDLDFRGIQALSETMAVLMSAGPGAKSRVYKTTDSGSHWQLLFTNPDAEGFWDCIAFWDDRHGILAGDLVNRQIAIFTTDDAGLKWTRQTMPPALDKEGAFAASNSSLAVVGSSEVWFGSSGSRFFKSVDRGQTWIVRATPVRKTSDSAGIFSVATSNARYGIAVGGDYAKDTETENNIAVTNDGGHTWTVPAKGPAGFRSAVLWLRTRNVWLTTGTSGSDIGVDGNWKTFDKGAFNALSANMDGDVWAVGPKGRIAKLEMK
jgi:photosystem II stability/assembly factor-like uncharacterized protein